MESKFNTFIFDIDGTLIDTYCSSLIALKQALYEITGENYKDDELSFHFGITLEDALIKLQIPKQYFDDISHKIDEIYYGLKEKFEIFSGVEEMLEKLSKRNVEIGIVTSKGRIEFEKDFKYIPIAKYFNIVICAEDTSRHKPNPDPIEKFIEITQAKKDTAIYIGDATYDLQAAHAAGVRFGLAKWGALNKNIKADYFFSNPSDILNLK